MPTPAATPSPLPRIVGVLIGWTLFVWTTRIGNVWRDHALDAGQKLGRTGLALSFTVLALSALVALVQRRGWLAPAVVLLAGWTTVTWVVRAARIATGDHAAGFIAVHIVLATISIALSVLAVRAVRQTSGRADLSSAAGPR